MSFLGEMLGAGTQSDFQAQGPGNGSPITQAQINQAGTGVGNSMQSQQGLLAALQAQNGLGNQSNVFNQLQTIASGGGPNPAQQQFQNNANQVAAQTAGMMGSQKGVSPALQARMIAQQGAGAQQQVAGQGAEALANQQMQALGAMGNMANTMAGNQVGQTNANTQANLSNQEQLLGSYGNSLNSANQSNTQLAVQNNKAQQGMFGGLLGGAGSILSDEDAKKDIHSADGDIEQFLNSIGAHEYKYKDPSQPGAAPGEHTGPMAQELEQSKVGQQMVVNTPEGKGVDFQRGMGTIVAALAHLNKKIESISGGKQNFADGGMVGNPAGAQVAPAPVAQPFATPFQANPNGPQSGFGKFLSGMGGPVKQESGAMGGENSIQGGMSKLTEGLGKKALGMKSDETLLGNLFAPKELGAEIGGELGSELGGSMGAGEAASALEGAEGAGAAAEGLSAVEGTAAASEGLGGSELLVAALARGGPVKKVNAVVSPGERYLPPDAVAKVLAGRSPMNAGEKIPGKAKVKGDSLKNDTVPKKLEVGGIVIPKSVMESKNPAQGAKDFVAKIIAKRRGKK